MSNRLWAICGKGLFPAQPDLARFVYLQNLDHDFVFFFKQIYT